MIINDILVPPCGCRVNTSSLPVKRHELEIHLLLDEWYERGGQQRRQSPA